jgi:hypothetical protein
MASAFTASLLQYRAAQTKEEKRGILQRSHGTVDKLSTIHFNSHSINTASAICDLVYTIPIPCLCPLNFT